MSLFPWSIAINMAVSLLTPFLYSWNTHSSTALAKFRIRNWLCTKHSLAFRAKRVYNNPVMLRERKFFHEQIRIGSGYG